MRTIYQPLLSILILLSAGCSESPPSAAGPSLSPRAKATVPVCASPEFKATHTVRTLNLSPERGPAPELGSHADLIWTFPDESAAGARVMGVELFRGRPNPIMNSPFEGESVVVRGFPATLGSIEDGFAIAWKESTDPCESYALTTYGLSKDETLRFADALRSP